MKLTYPMGVQRMLCVTVPEDSQRMDLAGVAKMSAARLKGRPEDKM